MSSPFFRFRQFTVWHDRCAMKVGTDGVLLGAWATPDAETAPRRILDVGTGSGLIALMLAQRFPTACVDALDLDHEAVLQARSNFAASPFATRLNAYHTSLQTYTPDARYDLIVSNPPYFRDSLKNPDPARNIARHTDTLSYADLLSHSLRLLAPGATLALILPADAEAPILHIISDLTSASSPLLLHPTRLTRVCTKPGKPAKRLLLALRAESPQNAPAEATPLAETFYIESATSPRSPEYAALCRDFYL